MRYWLPDNSEGDTMNLACALGFAACMTFNGQSFTAKNAVQVLDTCAMLHSQPAATFVYHPPTDRSHLRRGMRRNMGVLLGRDLEELGLDLPWPESAYSRKANWVRACRRFRAAFHTKSNWENLDEWPW